MCLCCENAPVRDGREVCGPCADELELLDAQKLASEFDAMDREIAAAQAANASKSNK